MPSISGNSLRKFPSSLGLSLRGNTCPGNLRFPRARPEGRSIVLQRDIKAKETTLLDSVAIAFVRAPPTEKRI